MLGIFTTVLRAKRWGKLRDGARARDGRGPTNCIWHVGHPSYVRDGIRVLYMITYGILCMTYGFKSTDHKRDAHPSIRFLIASWSQSRGVAQLFAIQPIGTGKLTLILVDEIHMALSSNEFKWYIPNQNHRLHWVSILSHGHHMDNLGVLHDFELTIVLWVQQLTVSYPGAVRK